MMKLNGVSLEALEAERRATDAEIVGLKKRGVSEEGPRLAALRQRRAELLGEIARRPQPQEALAA